MAIIHVAYTTLPMIFSFNMEHLKKELEILMSMMALRKVIDINIEQKKYAITGTITKMIRGISGFV